jgi:NAD(P)-dependent dehydrogenase (short-subunit alcohol dehydrogenase family)
MLASTRPTAERATMSTTNFAGKVALVTGAAGNLGTAAAAAFHSVGARLALLDLEMERLQKAYPGRDAERLLLAVDLLEEAAVARAVDAAAAAFGRIDIVCNIAGGFTSGPPVHETPAATWRRMFDLNVMSAANTVKAVVPRMIAAGRGNILNVAAASSVRGTANMAAYGVAKNAVVRLTESMADELRGYGICVCCIMPTIIDTPQNRQAMPGADTSQWTPASAIADVLLFLASDQAMVLTGCALPIAGRSRE